MRKIKTMKKLRRYRPLFILLLLLLLVAAFIWIYYSSQIQPEPTKHFTVEVVHSDGSQKTFSFSTNEEFIGNVIEDEGLIKGERFSDGLRIYVVDGEETSGLPGGTHWTLYVDGVKAETDIESTPAEDGGAYRLVYTNG